MCCACFGYLQLLRQLLDEHVLHRKQKPFQTLVIEGLTVFSAIALNESFATHDPRISERLLVS